MSRHDPVADDLRIQPLPALVSLVPAAGLFYAGVMTFKPNRVAEGVVFGIAELGAGDTILASRVDLTGTVMAALVVLIGLAVIVTSMKRIAPAGAARVALAAWAVLLTTGPWILIALGAAVAAERGDLTGIARVSPAAGTWLAMVGAVAAWHELLRDGAPARRAVIGLIAGALAAAVLALVLTPAFEYLAYTQEYQVRSERFWREARRHGMLAGSAVTMACLIGVPAGMAAFRRPRLRETILGFTSTIQTVPSLAMFGLLIAPLAALSRAVPVLRSLGVTGVGATPALIALTLYALLPIVRNTLTGLMMVPGAVRESGRAMGMQPRQQFWMVEVPLALPVVVRGVHTAAVQAVGNTTVAALIGAGGFGWFIFQGLGHAANDLVVLGVIPIILLAIMVDRLFTALQRITDWGRWT